MFDTNIPGISGIALLHRLCAVQPKFPILVPSMHGEAQIVTRALHAGANGYMTKNSTPHILLDAIRKLATRGRFIELGIANNADLIHYAIARRIAEERPRR